MDINLDQNTERINEEVSKNKANKIKRKKKIITISSIIAILILTFVSSASYIYTTISKFDNLIMPGVTIEGIDISGKTIEEATKLVSEKYESEVSKRNIIIKAADKQYTIGYSDLNLKYNVKETVETAFAYGKNLNSIERFSKIRTPEQKDFDLQFTYNNEVISTKVTDLEKEINSEKKDATIKRDSAGKFIITDEKIGQTLDVQALINSLNEKIASTKQGNVEVEAIINKDIPKKTKELLSKIDTKISSYSTNFATSTIDRATNIQIGAKTINGTLLMPGEKFSFSGIVGNTTPDKGYRAGKAIKGDQLVDDYGGGICQVSTTLHNAVIRTGILPDSRRNHSMAVSYVPPGLDATIAYGGQDYVFTNPYQFPIYVEGYVSGRNVTFNLYSNSSLAGKTYSFVSEVYASIPTYVKYEDDPTLEIGKEVVSSKGSNGSKVKVYRVTYENGKEVSRELMNNDTYNPYPKVIKRGTKPVDNTKKPQEPQKPQDPAQNPDPGTTPTTPTTP